VARKIQNAERGRANIARRTHLADFCNTIPRQADTSRCPVTLTSCLSKQTSARANRASPPTHSSLDLGARRLDDRRQAAFLGPPKCDSVGRALPERRRAQLQKCRLNASLSSLGKRRGRSTRPYAENPSEKAAPNSLQNKHTRTTFVPMPKTLTFRIERGSV
jgi:hypothetical protein